MTHDTSLYAYISNSLVLDVRCCVCLLPVNVLSDRSSLREYLQDLAKVAFKYRTIYLVLVDREKEHPPSSSSSSSSSPDANTDTDASPSINTNTNSNTNRNTNSNTNRNTNSALTSSGVWRPQLHQALSQYPCRIVLRTSTAPHLAPLIRRFCKDAAQERSVLLGYEKQEKQEKQGKERHERGGSGAATDSSSSTSSMRHSEIEGQQVQTQVQVQVQAQVQVCAEEAQFANEGAFDALRSGSVRPEHCSWLECFPSVNYLCAAILLADSGDTPQPQHQPQGEGEGGGRHPHTDIRYPGTGTSIATSISKKNRNRGKNSTGHGDSSNGIANSIANGIANNNKSISLAPPCNLPALFRKMENPQVRSNVFNVFKVFKVLK